jgi:hypothetical protein
MEEVHPNLVLAAVSPVGLVNCEVGLGSSFVKVRRNVDLDPHLFWELRRAIGPGCLRVTAGDKDTTVVEKLRRSS